MEVGCSKERGKGLASGAAQTGHETKNAGATSFQCYFALNAHSTVDALDKNVRWGSNDLGTMGTLVANYFPPRKVENWHGAQLLSAWATTGDKT